MKVDYEVPASGVKPTAPTHAEDAIDPPRYLRRTVLIIVALVFGFGLTRSLWSYRSAQQSAQAEPMPPLVTDEQSEIRLGRYLQLLEDPGGELTIDDVTSPEYQAQFVSNSVDVPNFGFTSSAYWARLALRNESGQADHRLLKLGFPHMQFVDLYTPLPEGNGFTVQQTGALRPLSSRDLRYPQIVFDLVIPPESEQIYYLRFENGASMTLPLSLWLPDAFILRAEAEIAVESIYFGAVLILALYAGIQFFVVRERNYLTLMIVLASLILFEATYTGYAETYFVPNLYFLKPKYFPLAFVLLCASMNLFTGSFLELKRYNPRLHRLNVTFLIGWGAVALLIPVLTYPQTIRVALPYALLSTGFLALSTLMIWQQGVIYSRIFLVAWLGLLGGFVLTIVTRIGLLPSTVLTDHAYQTGTLWLALGWSIALASRINLLKSDVESSERRLAQILESLPVGVVMYGKDRKPNYINKRVSDILSNPAREIVPDLSAGRTLEDAMIYFSFRREESDQAYPVTEMPIHRALAGETAVVDDIEADLIDRRVSLEIWARPIVDSMGNVEAALVTLQDISLRKQARAELKEYQSHLEKMVEQRTGELSTLNAWISFVNDIQHSLRSVTNLSHTYERVVTELVRLTAAASVSLGVWREAEAQVEITCLQPGGLQQDGPWQGVRHLTVSTKALSALHQWVEQDALLILPGKSVGADLVALQPGMTDTANSSIIIAPFESQYGTKGLLVLWMLRPKDSFTENEIRLFEKMRLDLAGLGDLEHLYDAVRQLGAAEERNRLARDLHDSVTQGLFSASVLADILPTILRRNPDQAAESLEVLRQLTRGTLAELRTLLIELRPAAIIKTPLHDLLSQLVEATATRSGLTFRLLIEQTQSVPEETHVTIYRVAQEALNNVVKHAQASHVEVRFGPMEPPPHSASACDCGVKLVISDDGIGFEPGEAHADHMGLGIMRERANDIDAELSIDSQRDRGTTVTLTWPDPAGASANSAD